MYGYDPGSARIVAWDKASGRYQAQYRITGGGTDWADVRGFYVVPRAAGQAPLVYWIGKDRIGTAALEAAGAPAASPSASPSAPPSASPKPAPKATRKPAQTARP